MASELNSTRSLTKNLKASSVPSAIALIEKMQSYLSEIEDPRVQRTRTHLLVDILVIGILSVIAGGKGWENMETYALSKQDWLKQFLVLPNGIPCPDTFRRVFERIDPRAFEQCFQRWVELIVETLGAQVIPLDGKTLKGSYDQEHQRSALHLVSAWASEHRLVLGQVKVDERSNEITAIPVLLELLDLAGCIISIDAIGTQTAITTQIYNVPVSELPTLHNQEEWTGLNCFVMVMRERHLWNETTHEVQFYLTSLESNAHKLGQAIRLDWGIENSLHWTLNATFQEDRCRVRIGQAQYNLALLRRIALNALNQEQSFRRSIRQKSNRAAMDNDYMLKVLAACLFFHDDVSSQFACQ